LLKDVGAAARREFAHRTPPAGASPRNTALSFFFIGNNPTTSNMIQRVSLPNAYWSRLGLNILSQTWQRLNRTA
jgi:hypothetical protein